MKCREDGTRDNEVEKKAILETGRGTDISGPMATVSLGGARYFVTFIDAVSGNIMRNSSARMASCRISEGT